MMMKHSTNRTGTVSVMAMLFLAVFASLAAAMAVSSQSNLLSADTQQRGQRSLAASETGVQFAQFRLAQIANNTTTTQGSITGATADAMWTQVANTLHTTVGVESQFLNSPTITYDGEGVPQRVELGSVAVSNNANAPTFRVSFEQHPLVGEDYGSAYYQRAPYNVGGGANLYTADGKRGDGDQPD